MCSCADRELTSESGESLGTTNNFDRVRVSLRYFSTPCGTSLRLLSLKCLCRYRFDEHLLLSGINSKRIEDEPNGRAAVIDALIVSPNGLLFELSIPDGSRNRRTSRGSYIRFRSRSAAAERPLFNYLGTQSLFIPKNLHFSFTSK